MTTLRVLCIDGGLGDLGWIIARVTPDARVRLMRAGVVHTTPTKTGKVQGAAAQLGTSVSADTMRRAALVAGVLCGALRTTLTTGDGFALAIESFTAPRGNPTAGVKVGMGLGAAVACAVAEGVGPSQAGGLHIASVTPAEVKRVLGVDKGLDEGASKAAVRVAVQRLLPGLRDLLTDVPDGRREHAYDAAGVLLACMDRDRFSPLMPMRT